MSKDCQAVLMRFRAGASRKSSGAWPSEAAKGQGRPAESGTLFQALGSPAQNVRRGRGPRYVTYSLSSPIADRSELALAVADIVAESMLRILDLDRSLRPAIQPHVASVLSLAGVSCPNATCTQSCSAVCPGAG